MNGRNPRVDEYLDNVRRWQEELKELRRIVLECGLVEELKWGSPCYTRQGRNIVITGELKEYCVLSFFKGSLLKDPEGLLEKPGKNTQAGRIIRFTDVQEIAEMESTLKAYIHEAVEVEKAGLKVPLKKTAEFTVPEEFQKRLETDPALKAAFEALTPGRQRGYLLYFSAPKRSGTRESRIEKSVEKILSGKGVHDW